jgi:tetratricopeptide (TPR) repeat protein
MESHRVLALILTSGHLQLLRRAVSSLTEWQLPAPLVKLHVRIVVNTLNPAYPAEVSAAFPAMDVVITESNGKPGKGHNSLIEEFRKSADSFDYAVFMDGDDGYYPCALQQLTKVFESRVDVVGIMTNDKVMGPWDPEADACVGLDSRFALKTFGDLERHWWRIQPRENPFLKPVYECNTPVRVLALSKAALANAVQIKYCEEAALFDDFLAYMYFLELARKKEVDVRVLSNTYIYIYTALNDANVTHAYRTRPNGPQIEDAIFRKALDQTPFTELKERWTGGGDVPFLCLGKPDSFSPDQKREFAMRCFVLPEMQKLADEAHAHYQAERYAEAAPLFDKLRQTNTRPEVTALNAGVCFFKTGKLAEAINCWSSMPIQHKNAVVHKNLGVAYIHMESAALAYSIFHLTQSHTISPDPQLAAEIDKIKTRHEKMREFMLTLTPNATPPSAAAEEPQPARRVSELKAQWESKSSRASFIAP